VKPRVVEITRARLKRTPLPQLDENGDKDTRGAVLVVGGSVKVAGAVLLAGVAALRAGAGKLQLATVATSSTVLGIAVPESLVVALPESRGGEISALRSAALLVEYAAACDAMLVGPGMGSERSARALVGALAPTMKDDATLVLDAAAVTALRNDINVIAPVAGRVVITPHAGEMATLLDVDVAEVRTDPAAIALRAAGALGVVVALKGAVSWIADPAGALFRYSGGSVGLATSGSGDTLAGIVAGLAARGASPLCAAMWGVYLHGAAGALLAKRIGRVGYLARELLDEVPPAMNALN
jgi:ADP-dependent NAD(P)H-hydrate dehydratase